MESTQANTKDHLHDAQPTNEQDGLDDDLPSESILKDLLDEHTLQDLLDANCRVEQCSVRSPSFVRCDRQTTSREGINLQVGGKITRQSVPGQKKVVVRPKTSILQPNANVTHCELDHSILVPREGDEEIAEEEAVCKFCFDILKEENILKTECGCRNALIHVECAVNQSRMRGNTCDSCGQEVRSFPVTLLRGLSASKRRDTQESSKRSYMSRLIRKLK